MQSAVSGPFLHLSIVHSVAAVLLLSSVLEAGHDELSPADAEFFEAQVRPLLVERCFKCHSGTKAKGGLSLETAEAWRTGGDSGPAIVPGKPEESLFWQAINYRDLEMPPADEGGRLSDREIAVLTEWIERGAPDRRVGDTQLGGMSRDEAASWWAFQPLPEIAGPPVPATIDQFLQKKLVEQGLTTARPADRRTLIRRATYDLTGLPPTPEDVAAFLADDSPDAFAMVIDRLLDSPQYGPHWGRHWLDVVRYADTAGENTDRPLPHAWRFRNWVLDAFARDLPYDEFVRQQLCGDLTPLGEDSDAWADGIIATGYLAIARRFGHDIDKDIHLMHEDVIDNLGKTFLGLTLSCTRCHDHKYDPFTSEDYYALYGIFSSTRFSFPGCEPKGQPRDLIPLLEQTEVDALQANYARRMAEYEQQTQAGAQKTARLKELADGSVRVLAESNVAEGQQVSLHEGRNGALDAIPMRAGEVLQLGVLPNGSHGADTTRVEWEISRSDGARWDVRNVMPKLTDAGPLVRDGDATWCFLDATDGPVYLHEKKTDISGQPSLSAWAIGDTPSVLANTSEEPVSVWTTLPGRSFFVHPGVNRTVAVAWICPADGEYAVRGSVADAHPAGGDGVAFRFEHFASPELGPGLIGLGELTTAEKSEPPQPPSIPVAYAVTEGEPANAHVQERGDPEQSGDEIPRRWLQAFGGTPLVHPEQSGRRELADWITGHPLFARVMANRIWQWHFGRGLVATPNDFGSRGEPPTHPELLDWLAAQFRAGGYRIKPMHRLIMLSATYQRGSSCDAALAERDPENHFLARFPRRRLSAEEIRDSLLAAGGRLDPTMGDAHPFPPQSGWTYTQHNPFNAVYDTNRRSVYLMVQRQRRHPYLALFDGADPNSSTPARQETTVPTQALFFLNDPFFHEQAAALAQRILQYDEAARIEAAFKILFQRAPSGSEVELAQSFLADYPGELHEKWAAYSRIMLASNEFLYVD